MSIYAKKDEVVTCENGHEIFKFIKDIHNGEMMDFTNQIEWLNKETKEPIIGTPIYECLCNCNSKYYRVFGGIVPYEVTMLHFKDGWR